MSITCLSNISSNYPAAGASPQNLKPAITCRNAENIIVKISPETLTADIYSDANWQTNVSLDEFRNYFKGATATETQKLEEQLIAAESHVYSSQLSQIASRYVSGDSIKSALSTYNVALYVKPILPIYRGMDETTVLQWLGDRQTGYTDLAYSSILLVQRGLVSTPPNNHAMALTRLNAIYQKVVNRPFEKPTTQHSLFLLKFIWEGIYAHYYH